MRVLVSYSRNIINRSSEAKMIMNFYGSQCIFILLKYLLWIFVGNLWKTGLAKLICSHDEVAVVIKIYDEVETLICGTNTILTSSINEPTTIHYSDCYLGRRCIVCYTLAGSRNSVSFSWTTLALLPRMQSS